MPDYAAWVRHTRSTGPLRVGAIPLEMLADVLDNTARRCTLIGEVAPAASAQQVAEYLEAHLPDQPEEAAQQIAVAAQGLGEEVVRDVADAPESGAKSTLLSTVALMSTYADFQHWAASLAPPAPTDIPETTVDTDPIQRDFLGHRLITRFRLWETKSDYVGQLFSLDETTQTWNPVTNAPTAFPKREELPHSFRTLAELAVDQWQALAVMQHEMGRGEMTR